MRFKQMQDNRQNPKFKQVQGFNENKITGCNTFELHFT